MTLHTFEAAGIYLIGAGSVTAAAGAFAGALGYSGETAVVVAAMCALGLFAIMAGLLAFVHGAEEMIGA